ncbi:ABC transporter, transmembrane region, type 1 [Desulforamulus reducens MI-1]|uniref:ABC transporter, transmembrane region, type 1 n=1 Tax=Desulforamulus reducens (strain ATCC BAA-1160 / DSM 100696 / MI-1) TaxID=349161 RepID=A4J517_DESRM|nr:thiol reductant ABC exporter subunit CydC [Desulforamulus reducens]ABO50170.1 ABC transporter, transmembrane region, type 1 [Desulforamulus reducens MI-1]
MKRLHQLLSLLLPHWLPMLWAVLLGFLAVGSNIGLLTTSAYLISRAAQHPPVLDLMVAIVGVRFFGIARAVFRYLERYFSHDVTFRVLSNMRVWFYKAIEPLATSQLMHYHSGDLLSRIVSDVETLKNFYLRVLSPPLVALLTLGVVFFLLACFDLRMAFIFLAFFIGAAVVVPIFIRAWGRRSGQGILGSKAQLNTCLVDGIQGMTDLLSFDQQGRQLEKIDKTNDNLSKLQGRLAKINGLAGSLTGLCMNLAMWTILVMAIIKVEQGELPGVYIAMLALATLSAFEAVTPLPLTFIYLEESMSAAKRLFELAETENYSPSRKDEQFVPKGYEIEFNNLHFRYSAKDPWILRDVSFTIPQGRRLAIVGPSGAGKSTLANLLLGFFDYQRGSLQLGGREVRDYHQSKLMAHMAVVAQRTHLFNATVRENILLARPGASEKEMIQAARRARIHDFILTLPEGYDTYVGEGGLKLSGGQRQRVAIARAILKNASVLILDEVTAGLDPVVGREIMQDLFQLMKDKTSLVISHHLVGLECMDEILVLVEGKVVEKGTHSQLLEQGGVYARMWQLSVR